MWKKSNQLVILAQLYTASIKRRGLQKELKGFNSKTALNHISIVAVFSCSTNLEYTKI